MPSRWRCLCLRSWVLFIKNQHIGKGCMRCICSLGTDMATMDFLIPRITYGGVIKILIRRTKSLTVKIVIGRVVMVGYLLRLFAYWIYFQKMRHIENNTKMILK